MRDKRLSRVDEEELEEILERRHKFEARKKRRKKLVIIGLIAAVIFGFWICWKLPPADAASFPLTA